MSLSVRAAGRTDTGRVRDSNEDALHIGERLFAVADGLGGHLAGEVASAMAVGTLAELDGRPIEEIVERLGETVRRANRLVHDDARSDPTRSGMGTTVTVAAIDGSSAHLAHVGDSRCYLLRDGDVSLLTEDHTVVGRMVADGIITTEQAAQHPQRSMLTRALGTAKQVDVDITHVPLRGGDRLLLCSDGLTAVVEHSELPRLLDGSDDLEELVDRLVGTALERGAPDNVTVLIVEVSGTPSGGGRAATSNGGEKRRTRRRTGVPKVFGIPRRALIWTMLIALVSAAGIIGVRTWVDGSYYVSFDDTEVIAIYNGVPVEIPVFTKREKVESFHNLHKERVREFQRREIEQGVIFGSLSEARDFVEVLRSELLPEPRVAPTMPSRRPEPKGSG